VRRWPDEKRRRRQPVTWCLRGWALAVRRHNWGDDVEEWSVIVV
jgi:hypothetical protein